MLHGKLKALVEDTVDNIQEEMDYEREEYQTGLSDEESSDDEQDEEDGLPDI